MDDLRRVRERQGLSVEQLSERTRIPLNHLVAMEEGRVEDLPVGPYAEMYRRSVREALGLTETPPPPRVHVPARPLWQVRAIAAAPVIVVVGLLAWQVTERWTSQSTRAGAPDQHLTVEARRNTHVTLLADGDVVVDRDLVGGEEVSASARERLELHLEATRDARLEYNGDRIVPQGRQDAPRRLVFIDDQDE